MNLTRYELERVLAALNDKIGDLLYMMESRELATSARDGVALHVSVLNDARHKLSQELEQMQ